MPGSETSRGRIAEEKMFFNFGAALKNMIISVEAMLQFRGLILTFLYFYFLLNVIVISITAGPAWRATSGELKLYQVAAVLARGAGAMINLNAAIVIILASRHLMTTLRGSMLNLFVPFDKAMPSFHA